MPPSIIMIRHFLRRLRHPLNLCPFPWGWERNVAHPSRMWQLRGIAPAILSYFFVVVAGVCDAAGQGVKKSERSQSIKGNATKAQSANKDENRNMNSPGSRNQLNLAHTSLPKIHWQQKAFAGLLRHLRNVILRRPEPYPHPTCIVIVLQGGVQEERPRTDYSSTIPATKYLDGLQSY